MSQAIRFWHIPGMVIGDELQIYFNAKHLGNNTFRITCLKIKKTGQQYGLVSKGAYDQT